MQTQATTPPALPTNAPFELQSLARAHNYQKWVADIVRPYLGSRIVELGAGIGNMSRWLPARELLVATEADSKLHEILAAQMKETFHGVPNVQTALLDLSADWQGQLAAMTPDTLVSFNVLEHIEDDEGTVSRFLDILEKSPAPGPHRLVTFVPAHAWAYGEMDRTFGHYKRYSCDWFQKQADRRSGKATHYYRYVNLAGLPSWWLLGRVLKKKNIGLTAIDSFEKLCPWIRGIDDWLHEKARLPFGQSLLSVITVSK